jgi:hypothetical protein
LIAIILQDREPLHFHHSEEGEDMNEEIVGAKCSFNCGNLSMLCLIDLEIRYATSLANSQRATAANDEID